MATRTQKPTAKKQGKKPATAKKPVEPKFSFITVRVAMLPGPINSIALNGERNVQAALEGAKLDADGYEIKVNGRPASLETKVTANATILLVKPIDGN